MAKNEAPEATKPTEDIKVIIWRPIKDQNGFTQGYESVEVPQSQAQSQPVPGGLAGKPNFNP